MGGPTGTLDVLNDDADALNTPTTAALRGTNVWVVNGQLTGLFGGAAPVLPFNAVSVPLAGGDVAGEIELPGAELYPEGIAAAPDGTLFIGSLNEGTILRIPAGETVPEVAPFVDATTSERGVVGLTVDADRDMLWFCDSSPIAPGGALVGVNLDTGVETVRHELPDPVAPGGSVDAGPDASVGDAGAPAAPTSFCNDVIVNPAGQIFITESSGRIFIIPADAVGDANSASVWLEHPAIVSPVAGGFGANGIALVGDRLIVSNGDAGTLVSVDPSSTTPASTVEVISVTDDGNPVTLCGPDGIEAVPGTSDLVVVENGLCTTDSRERVVLVTLDLD